MRKSGAVLGGLVIKFDHCSIRHVSCYIGLPKKWKKGKGLFNKIEAGEWAECIINNIDSGRIHTINSFYDDDDFGDGAVRAEE